MIAKVGEIVLSPLMIRGNYNCCSKEYTVEIEVRSMTDLDMLFEKLNEAVFDGKITIYASKETMNASFPIKIYDGFALTSRVEEISEGTISRYSVVLTRKMVDV